MVRHGLGNRAIASRRGTSIDATKFHIANLLNKLNLRTRAELRQWAGYPADSAITLNRSLSMSDLLQLGAIGQISFHVSDVPRAEAFFRDTLGLPHLFTFGDLAFFDCDGVRLFVSPGEAGSRANAVLYFRVPDIHAAHDQLKGRGVAFSDAPHMIHRHENGTEEWMAFFTDAEANTLAIMSQVPPATR
jgi:catechol 2,3-dioxygenase-like lactoylglutathione lyase family enzyme